MRLKVPPLLRSTATAASVLMLFAAPVSVKAATSALPFRETLPARDTAAAPTNAKVLKHLPAGRDELVFRGERASRSWSIPLGRGEISRISGFQLSLLNTVTVLPERSSLKLSINGHVLSTLPVQSPERGTIMTVKIPNGILVPGENEVRISVALTHRVDCSVKAAYELWASLDPAHTGLVVEGGQAAPIHTLAEVATEPMSEDGTTHIHLRTADGTDAAALGQAGRFIDALVRRSNLVRPIVDVGPEPGQGPGFDVVLTQDAPRGDVIKGARILGRDANVMIGRDAVTNRLVLAVSGTDGADIDRTIDDLVKTAPQPSQAQTQDAVIDADTVKTFGELGLAADAFAGRHYLANAAMNLPSDFYPANYDKAQLFIDGSHASVLDENSQIVFRVNGAIVSTLKLAAGQAEHFDHEPVELPLRFFHPGHNDLSIEGVTSTAADLQQCDASAMPREARLTIAPTSELQFPHFARLGTLPQIPAALADGDNSAKNALHVYLPDSAPGSVGAALTILANRAATMGRSETPILQIGLPTVDDVPGIVIAPFDDLPDALATKLGKITRRASATGGASSDEDAEAAASADKTQASILPRKVENAVKAIVARADTLLRRRGFFFSGGDAEAEALWLGQNTLLISAVAPQISAPALGGIQLPHFTRDSAQWLVLTALRSDTLDKGIDGLVANGLWDGLAGEAASFDLDNNRLVSLQPKQLTYVLPSELALSDVRPILGGIVSNNITLGFVALMALMSILGLSTYGLIRRMGVK